MTIINPHQPPAPSGPARITRHAGVSGRTPRKPTLLNVTFQLDRPITELEYHFATMSSGVVGEYSPGSEYVVLPAYPAALKDAVAQLQRELVTLWEMADDVDQRQAKAITSANDVLDGIDFDA